MDMSRWLYGSNDGRPPCKLLEIVLSIDTTGSMHDALRMVRGQINSILYRYRREKDELRLAVITHGDYCDEEKTYAAKMIDFSERHDDAVKFIKEVDWTGGGDEGECYEVALKMAREKLSWSKFSSKTLVVIGDSFPHEPDHKENKDDIDWREETQRLADMGVTIIGVQLAHTPGSASTQFFDTITKYTGGNHIKKMSEFKTILNIVIDKAKASTKSRNLSRQCEEVMEATPMIKHRCEMIDDKEVSKSKSKPGRSKRETIPDSKFLLKDLSWSVWKIAFKAHNDPDTKTWTLRNSGEGYKVRQLYVKSPGTYLYELSVQGNTGKKAVVFSKMSSCDPCSGIWESQLFGTFDVKKELGRVLTRNFKYDDTELYIRRARLADESSVRNAKQLLKKYDYAWSSHRMVVMDNVRASVPSGFNTHDYFWSGT